MGHKRRPGTLRGHLARDGELASLRGIRAREALRLAHVRLEEAQVSGDVLRRARQLRSQLQEQLAIARDRLATASGARTPGIKLQRRAP